MSSRLMLCAPSSGGGKTTVTCALLQALVNRGMAPAAFKSGPDYIDPMFHREVIGAASRNLDLFLMGETAVRRSLCQNTRSGGPAILEGAMGYYDGIAMTGEASAYELARVTDTPAVLVLDARGRALSAAALVKGFCTFRPDSHIKGVVFNRISPALYPRLRDCVEGEAGVKAFGFLPPCPQCTLESRHLGLITAAEVAGLREKLQTLAGLAEEHLDIDGLLALASSASQLEEPAPGPDPVTRTRPVIAVARDKAFCFYYAGALELLEELGARLAFFSPLEDETLPAGARGLYLGGGYPELYAQKLARNGPVRAAIRRAVLDGMPTVAECGGFLYLHRALKEADGQDSWPMAGTVPAEAWNGGTLRRFGYVTLEARRDGLLCGEGERLPAHEFHYWESGAPGADFYAQKPHSTRGWPCGWHTETMYAGFPHIHFCGVPRAAGRFVAACARYGEGGDSHGT